MTVAPGVPVPVTVLSRLLIGLTVGVELTVGDGVELVTVVVAGADTLPAGSLAVAPMTSPGARVVPVGRVHE